MSRHFKTKYLQKQRQRYFRRLLGIFCFFLVIGFLAYVLLFSNLFKINNIKVIGTKRVPEGLVRKEIETLIGGKSVLPISNNLVFVDISNIKKMFLADIDEVRVSKNFLTRTLNVFVVEKSPVARIVFGDQKDSAFLDGGKNNTYLSSEGKIFKSNLLNKEQLMTVTIVSQGNSNINQIWDEASITSFNKLLTYLKSQNIYKNSISFEYSLNTPSAITLIGINQYKIYLTLNADIVDAFNAANQFFAKEDKTKKTIASYIDMRFYPDKLYYK